MTTTTKTVKLPRLHSAQRQIDRDARRFNVVCCGRRWGKTKYGIRKLLEPAIAGKPVGWFSPTHKMLAEVWREVCQRIAPLIQRVNSQEHRIELITGGVVEFWSLDHFDSIRGRKYQRVIIDEAAMVAHLETAWFAVIRPTLTDLLGDAWLLSTPRGRNFFWRCYQLGLDTNRPDWQCWQLPTVTNPYINPSEIEAARLELPERTFQQEYLALFVEDAGGVFRNVRACAIAPMEVAPYAGSFVMGVDWAQKYDFTVLTVLDASSKQVVAVDRFNGVDWAMQRDRLSTLAAQWAITMIYAEQNSIGSPNIEALQYQGLPIVGFETTASSKGPLIQSLALAFEQASIAIPNDPILVGELEAYEFSTNAHTGHRRYHAPEGMHDDCVMSLALGWYGAQQTTGLFLW